MAVTDDNAQARRRNRMIELLAGYGLRPETVVHALQGDAPERVVVAYASALQGLGAPNSDVDVYVIDVSADRVAMPRLWQAGESIGAAGDAVRVEADTVRIVGGQGTRYLWLNACKLDVVYWTLVGLRRALDHTVPGSDGGPPDDDRSAQALVDSALPNREGLRILQKLCYGVVLWGEANAPAVLELADHALVRRRIMKWHVDLHDAAAEDAAAMVAGNDAPCGALRARHALQHAVGAWATHAGDLMVNVKWLPKVFERTARGAGREDLVQRFWRLEFPPPELAADRARYVHEVLRFTEDLMLDLL